MKNVQDVKLMRTDYVYLFILFGLPYPECKNIIVAKTIKQSYEA